MLRCVAPPVARVLGPRRSPAVVPAVVVVLLVAAAVAVVAVVIVLVVVATRCPFAVSHETRHRCVLIGRCLESLAKWRVVVVERIASRSCR